MEVFLLLARLFLALVFGTAGIAKALDRSGSRQSFRSFGVPDGLTGPLSWGLPIAEVLVAAALLPAVTAWWGAGAALAFLLVFSVGIGVNLARGKSPDCRCFGQLHQETVSWTTVARNVVMAGVALFVVLQGRENPGPSAVSWAQDLRAGDVVTMILGTALIGMLATAIVYLKRLLEQQAGLSDSIRALKATIQEEEGEELPVVNRTVAPPKEGLPIGAMAPKFSLATLDGERVSLDDLLVRGKFVVLLFAGPSCWGCKVLLPAVRVWQQDYADLVTVAVLSTGTLKDNQEKMTRFELGNLLLDKDAAVADEYQAKWSPGAVLIRPDGKIGSHLLFGDSKIREWLRNLISSDQLQPAGVAVAAANGIAANAHIPQVSINYSARKIGEMAPSFWLRDLDGEPVHIEDLRGSPTMLLFWHPLCEVCQTIFGDLKRHERNQAPDAPRLVFIACGEREDVEAVNGQFESMTLLDPAYDIGPLFGTKFTPSAILIDEEGRIASSLAMGAVNVRALVGLPKAELPAELEY